MESSEVVAWAVRIERSLSRGCQKAQKLLFKIHSIPSVSAFNPVYQFVIDILLKNKLYFLKNRDKHWESPKTHIPDHTAGIRIRQRIFRAAGLTQPVFSYFYQKQIYWDIIR